MYKITVIVFFAIISGCSVVKDVTTKRSESAPPTQDLFAFGSHYTVAGADELATEAAEKFCYQWRLVPAIKNKQTASRGALPDSAQEEIARNEDIPDWSPSMSRWETRLIYNCL